MAKKKKSAVVPAKAGTHQGNGRDIEKRGVIETGPNMGTSEAPMRNQMKAWAQYMGNGR